MTFFLPVYFAANTGGEVLSPTAIAVIFGAAIVAITLCAYTGFATVQDVISIWRTGSALPYAPPPPPAS